MLHHSMTPKVAPKPHYPKIFFCVLFNICNFNWLPIYFCLYFVFAEGSPAFRREQCGAPKINKPWMSLQSSSVQLCHTSHYVWAPGAARVAPCSHTGSSPGVRAGAGRGPCRRPGEVANTKQAALKCPSSPWTSAAPSFHVSSTPECCSSTDLLRTTAYLLRSLR